MIGTASGGLGQVSDLLNQLQGLVNQSANTGGLSAGEISANQLQVDSILSTINRIANSTNFNGTTCWMAHSRIPLSSTGTSAFAAISVNAANLANNKSEAVVVQAVNSATVGKVAYTSTGAGSALPPLRSRSPVTMARSN